MSLILCYQIKHWEAALAVSPPTELRPVPACTFELSEQLCCHVQHLGLGLVWLLKHNDVTFTRRYAKHIPTCSAPR